MKSQEKYPPQKNPAISEIKLWVQNFFGNFFASVGIFLSGVCAQGRARPGFWNGGTQGTAFCRDFANVCALRGPFLVVLP